MERNHPHRVVIVGGGFGGLWTARRLAHAPVEVTLIDRRNFHLFQPLLYQVATGGLSPADIASPLRGVLARQKNVTVLMDEMTGIDPARRQIILRGLTLPYDSLIIAVGSASHYFGHPEWERHAPGLKSIEDALEIRRRIFSAFEAAEKEDDPEERRRLLTFVVIGGGPTGVELAGAIGEIANISLRDDFRSIRTTDACILVVEGGARILPTFPSSLARSAERSLRRLGVRVRTDTMVESIDEKGVSVRTGSGKERIESATILWAAGVKPSAPVARLVDDPALLDGSGRIRVEPDLSIRGYEGIFAIGDLALVADEQGQPLPGVAPVAIAQGRYVADLIDRRIRGKPVRPFRYRNQPNMAVIGRAAAVADFGWARFGGYPAWLLWLFVHLMNLVEFDNRLIVLIQWAWSYFTRNRSARLITYELKFSSGMSESARARKAQANPAHITAREEEHNP